MRVRATPSVVPHPADPDTVRQVVFELLAPVVLVLLADGPASSAELAAALSGLGCEELDELALGELLKAAEADHLATSRLSSTPCAPHQRTYQLTEQGHETLRQAIACAHRTQGLLSMMASRYTTWAQSPSSASPSSARQMAPSSARQMA